ncbi:MAG: hypothetical protein JNJ49_07470 [Bdellovibrionaceae bacterium]|nr:hypothetical protein [Pseudobdellovibrionaceae bacterium]
MLRIQQWTAVLAVGIVMTLIGCKADQNTFTEPNASIGTGDGSGSIDSTAGFKLSLKAKAGVTTLLHKFGDYAAACEIAKGTTTPTSINCLLNMMEYDLYFYGFDLQVTVPADTCSFLEEDPYRFYKAEPGVGPSAISVVVNGGGTMTSCVVDTQDVSGTINGNVCYAGEVTVFASGTAKCAYDHTDDDGPNCCRGTGAITLTKTVGADTSVTSTEVDWGGTYEACTESPHDYIAEWPKLQEKAATVINGLNGAALSKVTKFPSVIKLLSDGLRNGHRSVFLHANMYDWAGYQANPSTWGTNAATVPAAFYTDIDRGPLGDRLTANGATALNSYRHGTYRFRCLGPAGELKQSITLMVQSWNTSEEFDAYLDTGDYAAADPYVQGTAGVDCSSVSTGYSCNSLWSFDDLTIVEGAGYFYPNEHNRSSPP